MKRTITSEGEALYRVLGYEWGKGREERKEKRGNRRIRKRGKTGRAAS